MISLIWLEVFSALVSKAIYNASYDIVRRYTKPSNRIDQRIKWKMLDSLSYSIFLTRYYWVNYCNELKVLQRFPNKSKLNLCREYSKYRSSLDHLNFLSSDW